jgi:hypothetical protein
VLLQLRIEGREKTSNVDHVHLKGLRRWISLKHHKPNRTRCAIRTELRTVTECDSRPKRGQRCALRVALLPSPQNYRTNGTVNVTRAVQGPQRRRRTCIQRSMERRHAAGAAASIATLSHISKHKSLNTCNRRQIWQLPLRAKHHITLHCSRTWNNTKAPSRCYPRHNFDRDACDDAATAVN